jgi:5-methylcytosine-specific restriction endonuclease McrA
VPWEKNAADRQRDNQVYRDPEYVANRALAMRRAGRACEQTDNGRRCGSTDRVSCDHDTPVSQGGTHHLDNLVIRCRTHHLAKTAQEGKGYRAPGRRAAAQDPVLQQRTTW